MAWLYNQTPFHFFVSKAQSLDFLPKSAPWNSIVVIHRAQILTVDNRFDLTTILPTDELLVFAGDDGEIQPTPLATLLSKGYAYDLSVRALRSTNNNVNAAISHLDNHEGPLYSRERLWKNPRQVNLCEAEKTIEKAIFMFLDPEYILSEMRKEYERKSDTLDPEMRKKCESSLRKARSRIEHGIELRETVGEPIHGKGGLTDDEAELIFRKGLSISLGESGPPDLDQAGVYWKQAADMGHTEAQYRYAKFLHDKKDASRVPESKKYFKMAADHGYTEAQHEYADLLWRESSKKNLQECCKYYQLAADRGYVPSQVKYGDIMLHSEEKWNSELFKQAAKYYHMAYEQGDMDGQCGYAKCLAYGLGVDVDITEAENLLRENARKGHGESMMELASILSQDVRRKEESLTWLRRAAEKGNTEAGYPCAKCSLELDPRDEAAMDVIRGLARSDHDEARSLLESIEKKENLITAQLMDEVQAGYPDALVKLASLTFFRDLHPDQYDQCVYSLFNCQNFSENPVAKYVLGMCLMRYDMIETLEQAFHFMMEADTEENHDLLVQMFCEIPIFGEALERRVPLTTIFWRYRLIDMSYLLPNKDQ